MIIAGLQKTSLIDYPGNICATVFLWGCNMRCPFCHNPELVEWRGVEMSISSTQFLEFLHRRLNVLDGVCVTGGEPTLQVELMDLLRRIKAFGLKVKLDTNGTNPEMLQELLGREYVDYVAMDVKGPRNKYPDIVRTCIDIESIDRSIELLRGSAIDYEFRTTIVPELVLLQDLIDIGKWLSGARLYVLQQYRPTRSLLDPSFQELKPYSKEQIEVSIPILGQYVQEVKMRGM
jgi:pyruvate formate lyase activating enzyme